MKSNNRILTKAAIILAAMVSVAGATTTYTKGDLLLGFRATSGTGADVNYIVNLGKASSYTSATGTFSVSVGNIGADLTRIYGSDWQTSQNVTWSIIGSADNLSPYVTNAGTTDAAATIYYSASASEGFGGGAQKTASSVIIAFETATAGYSTSYLGTNLSSAFAQVIAATDANSLTSNLNGGRINPNTLDFGLFTDLESNPNTTLSLWRDGINTGSANQSTLVGTFSLGSNGAITFTSVPEPTTALLGGLGTLMLLKRRRNKA